MSMCFTEFGKPSLGWGRSREVEKLLLIVGGHSGRTLLGNIKFEIPVTSSREDVNRWTQMSSSKRSNRLELEVNIWKFVSH